MSQSSVIELGSDELDDDETEKEYEVQAITGQRISGGSQQYLVKWVGYPKPTWEPAASISVQVPDMMREYEETLSLAEESNPRMTRSRTVAAQTSQKTSASDSNDEDDSKFTPVLAARASAAWCL